MLKVGLIGFGFMGCMYFDNYVCFILEGEFVELVVICDLRIEELKYGKVVGNMVIE